MRTIFPALEANAVACGTGVAVETNGFHAILTNTTRRAEENAPISIIAAITTEGACDLAAIRTASAVAAILAVTADVAEVHAFGTLTATPAYIGAQFTA